MLPTAAFTHARELTGSMSVKQLLALGDDIDKRLYSLLTPTRTFEIAEILESILEYLDFFDLFKAMRVDRCFCATIIGSPRLRRKLFLPQPGLKADSTIGTATPVQLNPMFERMTKDHGFTLQDAGYQPFNPKAQFNNDNIHLKLYFESDTRIIEPPTKAMTEGLWAQMHVTPEPVEIRVCFAQWEGFVEDRDFDCRFLPWGSLEAGKATLGSLYDMMVDQMRVCAELRHESKSRREQGHLIEA